MFIAISLHLLAAVVWVGGMFFAYMALRPVAAASLEPPQRLTVWAEVFKKFFPWVWMCIVILLASGYWMVFFVFGGFKTVGMHVHLMQLIGIVMILLFAHVYYGPFARLKKAVEAEDWPEGGAQLGKIRMTVGINLILGLALVVIASGGRYL